MAENERKTFITGELNKVPPEIRELLDPTKPLPAEVLFFEKQQTWRDMMWMSVLGSALIVVGALLCGLGLVTLILPVIGIVLMVGGAWILYSLRTRIASMNAQRAGKHTRYGIFLRGDALMEYNEFGVTIIPRNQFQGLANGTVSYQVNDETKSFQLPAHIVGADVSKMENAIQQWEKSIGAQA